MVPSGTEDHLMETASIGIGLGKTTFHSVGLDHQGTVVVRKKFSPQQLLAYTANPSALKANK